ncbi:MAG: hypothetical protein JWR51_69 [Devosia sp.]|uniref:hypothetical protein n=1 Tax=Devosia sp. TaxID=1871048 RepID=UPI002618BFE5|nr:hypothetical protein [Devosia sp.]MDB5526966.1 hypothetical protein [Devosia sp.]
MRKYFIALALTVTISSCSGYNINRMQFSNDAVPFPDNYQVEAARAVAAGHGNLSLAQVSRPQAVVGENAFGPKRWYSCVSGLPAPSRNPKSLPNIEDAVGGLTGSTPGVYYAVLFFSAEGRRPSVKTGFDSQLCQGAAYEPITTAVPVTQG